MSKETYPWYFRSGRILVAIDLTEHLAGLDPEAPLKGTSDKYVRKGLAKHLREHGYVVRKKRKGEVDE